jgi:hypothetical protein
MFKYILIGVLLAGPAIAQENWAPPEAFLDDAFGPQKSIIEKNIRSNYATSNDMINGPFGTQRIIITKNIKLNHTMSNEMLDGTFGSQIQDTTSNRAVSEALILGLSGRQKR